MFHRLKLCACVQVLATVAHVLLHDQENRATDFHQLAYHRLTQVVTAGILSCWFLSLCWWLCRFFIMLLSDLSVPDPVFDAISYAILHAFG